MSPTPTGPAAPDWALLDATLDAALDLDGEARDAYVAALDPPLRDALAPLLRDALRDDGLLDQPQRLLAALHDEPASADVAEGVRVGPYRIEALVGEGGMGRVYRAHRADGAFDRTVAVKMVRSSLALAGSDVAARLRRERDLLAALDHPNIARLVDGGETDDGVPYLVTDFVDGAPITTWADAHALDARARARLVLDVARAVDHAHRRFVLHRDLKPSNVLVSEAGGAPRPVVLDFGIAKLLADAEDGTGDAFPLTRTGMRLLTPAYAAPELFDPTLGVTVAVDVYGLGAILYELLTGRRPHGDAPTAPTAEPTRPSRAAAEALPGGSNPASTRARALRGDLDLICLRALHPDPARRYASASALADDLGRFLSDRPVEARPDSLGYVTGRFVRRHRALVVGCAVAVFALVAGLSVSLVSLSRERTARTAAETSASQANEATQLLVSLFKTANPERGRREVTAREVLDSGLARVASIESPALRGYLLGALGETYDGIGDLALADSLLAASLALLEAQPGVSHDRLDRLRIQVAYARSRLHDDDRAKEVLQPVVARRRLDDTLGILARGRLLLLIEDPDEIQRGVGLARDLVRGAAAHGDPALLATAVAKQAEFLVWVAERTEEAIPPARRALALLDALHGPDHRSTRFAATTLARALSQNGDHAEAIALYRQALASTMRVHGPDSQDEAYDRVTLAEALLAAGRAEEAEAELDHGIAMALRFLPDDHEDIGWWLQTAATIKNRRGAYRAAEAAARRSLTIADHAASGSLAGRALGQLGLALAGQGRDAEARTVLQRAAAALRVPADMPTSYQRDARALLADVNRALGSR